MSNLATVSDEVQTFELHIPFSVEKMDDEKQIVEGYASRPGPDVQGEDIDSAAWTPQVLKDYMDFPTLRAQHDKQHVAGRVEALDARKEGLYVRAHVLDPVDWLKVKGGGYNGFSVRGSVASRDPRNRKHITKMKELEEISLVDRPAKKDALFEVIKMDDGKYGDVEYADEEGKKYPLDTKEHVRAAASYFGMPKNRAKYSTAKQKLMDAKIAAAEKRFRIGVEKMNAGGSDVIEKGMWNLQQLASLLQNLKCLYDSQSQEEAQEGDDESTLPDGLAQALHLIGEILLDMAEEETEELLEDVVSTQTQKDALEKVNELLKSAGLDPISEDVVQKAKVSKSVFHAALKDSIEGHKHAIAAHREAIADHADLKDEASKMDEDEDYSEPMKKMGGISKAAFKGESKEKVEKLADTVKELAERLEGRRVQKSADVASNLGLADILKKMATRMDEQADTIQKLADKKVLPARGTVLSVEKGEEVAAAGRKAESKEDVIEKMKSDKLSSVEKMKMLLTGTAFKSYSQVLGF